MEKNQVLKFFLMIGILFFANSLFADVVSPLELVKNVGIDQAQENLIPTAIVWILIFTGTMSAMMGKMMPFILGCVGSVIMAVAPDVATAFNHFDFKTLSDGTTMSVK